MGDEDQPRAVIVIGPGVKNDRFGGQMLHGVDDARPAFISGQGDDPLDAQQPRAGRRLHGCQKMLKTLSRKRFGSDDREGRDAVSMPVDRGRHVIGGAVARLCRQCGFERQPSGDIVPAFGRHIRPFGEQGVQRNIAPIDHRRAGVDPRQLVGQRCDVGNRRGVVCQVGLGQHDPVGECDLLERLEVPVDRGWPMDNIK